jgi:hypothetical protein
VEIMALRLRENKNINGIKVKIDDKAHIIKISQLADDTTLFVSSKTDIALAMNEIEIFGSLFLKISDIHPLFITQVCILLYNVSTQVTKE